MSRNAHSLVAIAALVASCSYATVSYADAMFGSGPAFIYIVKNMLKSNENRDCTISFLQNRFFPDEVACEENNKYLRLILQAKHVDASDQNQIKLIERDVIIYLVGKLPDAANATLMPFSDAPWVYVIKHMLTSPEATECVIYLFQHRSFSEAIECKDTKRYLYPLFDARNIEISSQDQILDLEASVIRNLVKFPDSPI